MTLNKSYKYEEIKNSLEERWDNIDADATIDSMVESGLYTKRDGRYIVTDECRELDDEGWLSHIVTNEETA